MKTIINWRDPKKEMPERFIKLLVIFENEIFASDAVRWNEYYFEKYFNDGKITAWAYKEDCKIEL